MKKGLLIAAGVVFGLGASAQYVASDWEVHDATNNVKKITLNPSSGFFVGDGAVGTLDHGYGNTYTSEWTGDVIKIDFTNTLTPNQYSGFGFTFADWVGETGNKFKATGVDSDTLVGYSINFSSDEYRKVTFKVQASAALNLRLDLVDKDGKTSNGAAPRVDVPATSGGVAPADASKWQSLIYAYDGDATADAAVDILEDWYSPKWWEVVRPAGEVELNAARIIKVVLTIDDAALGTLNDAKTLYVKDLQILAEAPSSLETVSGAILEVIDGVVYSKGAIVVTNVAGQVVASANGSLSIASLPAGVLIITAAEGVAKIVK